MPPAPIEPTTLPRVVRVIARETGMAPSSIEAADRIVHDLGVWGDDLDGLMTAVAQEFDLDLSGVSLLDAVPGEMHLLTPLELLWRSLRWAGGSRRSPLGYRPVYVRDLASWAESGIWPDLSGRPFESMRNGRTRGPER